MSLTLSTLAPRAAAFTSQQQRPARSGRRLQRCYAAADDDKKQLDFQSNQRAALGFTDNDSAGQTNIFAVEPKTYVAGSSADTTAAGGQATILIGAIGAVGAVALFAGGLLTNSGTAGLNDLAPAAGTKTLTEYSQIFAAETSAAKAAPALSD